MSGPLPAWNDVVSAVISCGFWYHTTSTSKPGFLSLKRLTASMTKSFLFCSSAQWLQIVSFSAAAAGAGANAPQTDIAASVEAREEPSAKPVRVFH